MRSQGWQNVPNSRKFNCLKKASTGGLPCGGRGVEEPDQDDGGVFEEGEAIVEDVFVPSAFLLSVEEHEDVDDA